MEFWSQTSLLSLSTVDGLVGGVGGTALGFALGNMVIPGVGGLLGGLVGGLTGGITGDKIMMSNYQSLENRLENIKHHLNPSLRSEFSHERYQDALKLLDSQN